MALGNHGRRIMRRLGSCPPNNPSWSHLVRTGALAPSSWRFGMKTLAAILLATVGQVDRALTRIRGETRDVHQSFDVGVAIPGGGDDRAG